MVGVPCVLVVWKKNKIYSIVTFWDFHCLIAVEKRVKREVSFLHQ